MSQDNSSSGKSRSGPRPVRKTPRSLRDLDLVGGEDVPEASGERAEGVSGSLRRYLDERPPHHDPR